MITQKFLIMMEKVWESVEYKHLNDAFDALIDAANENYERQEGLLDEEEEWYIQIQISLLFLSTYI